MPKPLSKPFFSIVIPTLNEEVYLPLLLEDLSNQTFRDFEVIHVDGQSEDETLQKAAKWNKKLDLKTITCKIRSVAVQRNMGGDKAQGDWIVFMDADNRLPSYFLQGIKYRIERAEAKDRKTFDVFTTLIHLNDEDELEQMNKTSMNVINSAIAASGLTDKPMAFGAMIGIRAEVFAETKFNPKNKVNEDSIFLKNCIKKRWRYKVLTDPTYAYSMRRMKENGLVKTAASGLLMNVRYAMGSDMSEGDCGYKMDGGGMYSKSRK